MIRDYFVRNRVSFGFLLGSGVLFFLRPASERLTIAGLAISFLGLLIRTWAAGYIKKSKSLCTEGPYAVVRHPLYLGSFLMSAGIGAVFTNTNFPWSSSVFWVTYLIYFWSFYSAAIIKEEKLLSDRFTEEWTGYKKKTPALLPFRWPQFKNLRVNSFSFAQYNKNKEYNALIGWMGIVALIFLEL